MRLRIPASVLALVLAALPAAAQQPAPTGAPPTTARARGDTVAELRLRDGSVLFGRVLEQDAERVVFMTTAGVRLEVPRAQVESLRTTGGRAVDGAFWVEDPNGTRLFFTSTARPLRKGTGYISSLELVLPMLAYGVTDRFTIAGGTPILPEAIGRVWYLAPKYTVYSSERSAYALGALAFLQPEDIVDRGSFGIVYGSGTWGSRDHALTAGAGWGYYWTSGESEISPNPALMLGGETRISRRVKLISENWFLPGNSNDLFISGGVRFIGDRLSADLGVGGMLGNGTGCCVPLVNFVYNFGKR